MKGEEVKVAGSPWVSRAGAAPDHFHNFHGGLVLCVFTREGEALLLPGLIQPCRAACSCCGSIPVIVLLSGTRSPQGHPSKRQYLGWGPNPAAGECPNSVTKISSLGSKRCLNPAACSAGSALLAAVPEGCLSPFPHGLGRELS